MRILNLLIFTFYNNSENWGFTHVIFTRIKNKMAMKTLLLMIIRDFSKLKL